MTTASTIITNPDFNRANSAYEFTVKTIRGEKCRLDVYTGHVVLIVNVATKSKAAKEAFRRLNQLHEKYSERDAMDTDKRRSNGYYCFGAYQYPLLVVKFILQRRIGYRQQYRPEPPCLVLARLCILAFPCNQFGLEEPGTDEEIITFMTEQNVKFDVFEKVEVNGLGACPLWKYLKYMVGNGGDKGSVIKNNFTMFITNKLGEPQERFGLEASQDQIMQSVEMFL